MAVAKKEIITQLHHCIYGDGDGKHDKALTVRLRKGEHALITWLRRWCAKTVSIQFIRLLRYTAARLEMDRTVNKIDLDKGE